MSKNLFDAFDANFKFAAGMPKKAGFKKIADWEQEELDGDNYNKIIEICEQAKELGKQHSSEPFEGPSEDYNALIHKLDAIPDVPGVSKYRMLLRAYEQGLYHAELRDRNLEKFAETLFGGYFEDPLATDPRFDEIKREIYQLIQMDKFTNQAETGRIEVPGIKYRFNDADYANRANRLLTRAQLELESANSWEQEAAEGRDQASNMPTKEQMDENAKGYVYAQDEPFSSQLDLSPEEVWHLKHSKKFWRRMSEMLSLRYPDAPKFVSELNDPVNSFLASIDAWAADDDEKIKAALAAKDEVIKDLVVRGPRKDEPLGGPTGTTPPSMMDAYFKDDSTPARYMQTRLASRHPWSKNLGFRRSR